MSSKKWVISMISITISIILLFGVFELYIDPLLQYGEEPGHITYREYSELYSNPGIAKNYKYNAVLLGSSMVENTDVSEINSLMNCTTIKVPYSGGSSYNHKTILDVCYSSDNRIDIVFWSLDEYALTTDKDTPRYPLPSYLYDNNYLNDVSYLLNLDIFYFYTVKDLLGTLTNKNQIMMRDGSWISDESVYCKENALSSISYPMNQNSILSEKHFSNNLEDNIKYNIIPLIESHPETEFIFYMVPYSILYWYKDIQNGILEAEIYNARIAAGEILKYDNAKVFFFQNERDIITNLDNYKDFSHFKPEINSYMSKEIAAGNNELTLETYNKKFDEFKRFLTDFDYDSFIKNSLE